MSRRRHVALAACAAAAACTELPEVDRGLCGNGVIEPAYGEDCDHTGDGTCGAPDTAAACRRLCAFDFGEGGACPDGSVCGGDGVCHAPSGFFTVTADLRWTARSLLIGDTTFDGYPELVGVGDQEIVARLGAADGTYSAAVSVPNLPVYDEPRMSDVNGDGAQDLTIPVGFGLYTLAGNPFSVVQPLFQNTFPVPSIGPVVATNVTYMEDAPGFGSPLPSGLLLSLMRVPEGPRCPLAGGCEAFVIGEGGAGIPGGRSLERYGGDEIPWGWLPGQVDARFHTALAFTDDPATPSNDESGLFLYRVNVLTLPPDVTPLGDQPRLGGIAGPAWFADVDGDGLVDLLATIEQTGEPLIQVAWGRADGTFAPPVMLIGPGAQTPGSVTALAWGDLTGDGRADLVASDTIGITSCVLRACTFGPTLVSGRAWIDARIGDVDGDGRPDVVAHGAAASVADVLRNSGLPALWNDSPVAAPGALKGLRLGDFDGSGTADIAMVTTLPGVPASDDLHVAFGRPGAAPAPASYMGYIGEHVAFDTATTLLPGRFDTIADLVMVGERGGERGAALVLGSTSQRMIAPLIPLGENGAELTVIEGIVSLPLDGDGTADIIALTTEHFFAADRADSVVRVYAAAPDGALHERTPATGVPLDTTAFVLQGARWVAIPALGAAPSYIVGVDTDGRAALIAVTCNAGVCTVAPPVNLTGARRGGDATGLHATDLDGDGDLDLVAAFRPDPDDPVDPGPPSHVRVWTNGGGDAGFTGPVELAAPAGTVLADVVAIDLALDGRPSLLAMVRGGDEMTPRFHVAAPDGGGGFAAFAPFSAGGFLDFGVDLDGGITLAATDVTGDGLPDLVATFGPDRTAPQNLKVLVQLEARKLGTEDPVNVR